MPQSSHCRAGMRPEKRKRKKGKRKQMDIKQNGEALDAVRLPRKGAGIFFIGIGGVSMSALAIIAKERGYRTGGSDRAASQTTHNLQAEGIEVFIGHDAAHLDGYDAVVFNAAISEENPELRAAKEKGLLVIYRADFMAALMDGYPFAVGVAGMHGKSTTSAWISHIFLSAARDPSVLIGAALPEIGGSFRTGRGDAFVFEACEYRDSFLSFRPNIAVVLNIEMDHPDYFKSLDQIIESYRKYIAIPGKGGAAVLNFDDPNVRKAAEGCHTPCITCGINNPNVEFRAVAVRIDRGFASFEIQKSGVQFCRVSLQVPGAHQVMNALQSAAAADFCGVSRKEIEQGLSSFRGVGRRLEYKGLFKGTQIPVFDDFAHHPTEIRASLGVIAQMGYRKLFCVYQPHTYSRTAKLFDSFTKAFDAADILLLTDIYAARESNTYGVTSKQLSEKIPQAVYCADDGAVTEFLRQNVGEGDVIVIMGAGNISRLADEITETDAQT